VALRDVRDQLFDAAERVLRRSGPQALTSRAVTSEAGCAKGVLHRHFADFDEFLVELINDRAARLTGAAAALVCDAGTATVTANVAATLTSIFQSVALAIVGLLTFRDDLRARVRADRPTGLPVLSEAAAMLGAYLAAEQGVGRVRAEANVDLLALTLIGTGHMVFAGRAGNEPDHEELDRLILSIIGPALA
jgi:AcrR family transcriptional regulator